MSNTIIIKIYYRMFDKFDQMVWKTRNNQNNKNTCTVSGNVTFQEAIKLTVTQ